MEQTAELLNHDLLRTTSLTSVYWVEEMMQEGICYRAETIKEPFAAVVNEDSVIPDELVMLLEKALYHSVSPDIKKDNSSYYKMLAELGADQYDMDAEEIIAAFPEVGALKEQAENMAVVCDFLHEQMDAPKNIEYLFHLEGNRYLFVYKSGGTKVAAANLRTDNLRYPSGEVLQADIANLGIPVFMQKIRSWGETEDYAVNFYLRDPQTNVLLELDQLSIKEDQTNCLRLVDLWFKVIGNKTLTFSMYYASGYSYMLNIMLLEGSEANPVEAWLLLPEREFVLTEGEVFSTAG